MNLIKKALSALLKGLILFYRGGISPYFPSSCRFQPTCSAYALEAIEIHGPFKGFWLAVKRIGKCHPVKFLGASDGYDPVPPKETDTPN